tara:strand:+ start:133 stop:876 length:744 start_codon:yes stop_codon:yes gene_type:complete
MNKTIVKYSTIFFIIINFSCGGGGGSGEDDIVAPPPSVVVITPPLASTLIYPENNEICETGTSISLSLSSVNFQWSEGTNSDSYDLELKNLENNNILEFKNISGTSRSIDLTKGKPYSWKIISKRNGTDKTASSEVWKFYLSGEGLTNYPPFPASLLSPISGKSFTATTTSIELKWEGLDADGDILTYDLFIDQIDGKQKISAENANLASTSKVVEVISGNSYFWRIKTIDSNGNSSFSIIYSFRID